MINAFAEKKNPNKKFYIQCKYDSRQKHPLTHSKQDFAEMTQDRITHLHVKEVDLQYLPALF